MISWHVKDICKIRDLITGLAVDDLGLIYITTGEALYTFNQLSSELKQIAIGPEYQGKLILRYDDLFIANQMTATIYKYNTKSGKLTTHFSAGGYKPLVTFSHQSSLKYICRDDAHLYYSASRFVKKIPLENPFRELLEVIAGSSEIPEYIDDAYNPKKVPPNNTDPFLLGAFKNTSGVAVGKDGTVYVGDSNIGCVQKIKNGKLATVMSEKYFGAPQDIILFEDRQLIVIDNRTTIKHINLHNNTLYVPPELKVIQSPTNLAMDSYGNVYVGTLGGEIYKLEHLWKFVRYLWIGFLKEEALTCPLRRLPVDLIREIASWVK